MNTLNNNLEGIEMNDTNISEFENSDDTESDNILQRAKDAGFSVKEGTISLPGSLKKVKEELRAKTPVSKTKANKAVTPKTKVEKIPVVKTNTIGSDIMSSGNILDIIIEGLSIVRDTMKKNELDINYKISTYKNELRLAFEGYTGAEIIGKMSLEDAQQFNHLGFEAPDKKSVIVVTIAPAK